MKFSDKNIKTLKESKEFAVNADLLVRAGYVNQLSTGIYTLLGLGKRVSDKIAAIVREEMDAVGGSEILMPALQPAQNWKQTGRWEAMDDLFKFTSFYSKTDYALGATHEEVVTPLVRNYVKSYKDLPLYLYQIQTKFRDEKRAKSGLLRNREFLMKDLYSFHTDTDDLEKYYGVMTKAYQKVFRRLGIGDKTFLTYASGGSFAKYSHEFQTVTEAGEDIIYLCEKCRVAVNKEIIAEQNSCPVCGNKKLVEEKAIEVGNIFKLGTKFSQAFDLTYKDATDKEQLAVMGCYGIGITRLIGAIVEVSHDERGIVWPAAVAPFDFHLVSLDGITKEAGEVYKKLQEAGFEVLWDDREESAGSKLADADLIGIPKRLVVSAKTVKVGLVEIKNRGEKAARQVKLADILKANVK